MKKYIPILVDWLLDVCREYDINLETFMGMLDILNKFIENMKYIPKEHLQLLGCVCLHLAYKVIQCDDEDEFSIDDWIRLSVNIFDRKEFETMERKVLEILHYEIYQLIRDPFPMTEKDILKVLENYGVDILKERQKEYISKQIMIIMGQN